MVAPVWKGHWEGGFSRKGAKPQREMDDSNSEWLNVMYPKYPESYKGRQIN